MTNIYWPVYKNIESELVKLTYDIHIDDNQINVYSSKISDLILRSAAEIESVAKELYKRYGGNKEKRLLFDKDCIKFLNQLWKLENKLVIISSSSCFQSQKIITPFIKTEKNLSNKLTYGWNNAYQHLKHNRYQSLHLGSLKYLFDILAALFILNLYFRDEVFEITQNSEVPQNMGSEIFSIKIHKWRSYDAEGVYGKNEDFDECIYLTKKTDEAHKKMIESTKAMLKEQQEMFLKHPKTLEFVKSGKLKNYEGDNLMWDVLGENDYWNIINITSEKHTLDSKDRKMEGVLNKNLI
ncbi:hypothetical protein [Salegentibacter mishustinae]|uniref:Uncharacterized protein n=1 Tax=Salegentibacter mishustinae TaxID=270918 RepID=A0A0Q9ZHL6_9FLAO|nr:hypothetical protein [Salegentibacter mishustinae]KRG29570.1 hypothetical protein APR42_16285 [Salegentibacter mishustinae]PNW21341.1 hypothetical protein APB85_08785 [Salegentibacter mishustinae]PZX60632.1 hypothetical protein LY54_03316 [Salegentibacter mishustinae]GGX00824.1 hypothetical protein GCM10008086_32380 [Salegentibacter mishustinae]|tara:strand:- start:5 stop:892 length:888 start_codon:yes stop_codon:yes gene_type:complete